MKERGKKVNFRFCIRGDCLSCGAQLTTHESYFSTSFRSGMEISKSFFFTDRASGVGQGQEGTDCAHNRLGRIKRSGAMSGL